MKHQRLALFGALILASAAALAAIAHGSWTNATQNTDGSAIPASGAGSLTSTTMEWSVCGVGDVFTTQAGQITVPAATRAADSPDLPPGRWCFRAYHTNSYGEVSAPSAVGVKVVPAPKPNPPTNFSIG